MLNIHMTERFSHEVPLFLRLLGAWRINRDSIDFKWGYFAPRAGFEFKIHQGLYFDRHWGISICPLWGHWSINLPFLTSREEQCENPDYGISIHNDIFWIHLGRPKNKHGYEQDKWWTWDLPFFSWCHDKTEVAGTGDWVDVTKGLACYEWKDQNEPTLTAPYAYTLHSGKVQRATATVYKERRTWHRKWFPFLKMINTTIDVTFSEEIGEGSGSWKGGVVGASHEMLPNEPPLETLRRMERESKFNR